MAAAVAATTVEAATAVEAAATAVEATATVEVAAAMEPAPAVEASVIEAATSEAPVIETAADEAAMEAVEPRAGADEDAADKVVRAVVTVGCASVRVESVVAVGADRRAVHRSANRNTHAHLRASRPSHGSGRHNQKSEQSSIFEISHREPPCRTRLPCLPYRSSDIDLCKGTECAKRRRGTPAPNSLKISEL
jgi:hypothetical protein